MCLIVRCSTCGKKNRFKGKSSEVSRGKDIICAKCQTKIILGRKSNGKVVVLEK